jgi:hypothetical protein
MMKDYKSQPSEHGGRSPRAKHHSVPLAEREREKKKKKERKQANDMPAIPLTHFMIH